MKILEKNCIKQILELKQLKILPKNKVKLFHRKFHADQKLDYLIKI